MDSKNSAFQESLVDNLMGQACFCSKDFVQSRNRSLTSEDSVKEILFVHLSNLTDTNDRRKYTKKKEAKLEQMLTRSGLKKLQDARNQMRVLLQKNQKRLENMESVPSGILVSSSSSQFKDIGVLCGSGTEIENPSAFFQKMQEWGNMDVDDCKYYLHMVFRFYLSEYHALAVENKLVIANPSLQKLNDTVSPNGCATKFPPEFRRFMNDSGGRNIKIAILPLPVKGSATEVTYANNFENCTEVSLLRRKIHGIFSTWRKNIRKTVHDIYPEYLHRGHANNDAVVSVMQRYEKIEKVKKNIKRLDYLDTAVLVELSETRLADLYEEYSKHTFKTPGEQLKERLGFFYRSSVRSLFYKLKEKDLLEDLLFISSYGTDVYLNLENYCSVQITGRQLILLEKDEASCRKLLMVLVEICFLMNIFKYRELAQVDSSRVVSERLARL